LNVRVFNESVLLASLDRGQHGLERHGVRFGNGLGAAAEAVGIARELAMTTFRAAEEFRQRFSMEPYRKGEAWRNDWGSSETWWRSAP
jgi:hypothetical protein